uniref:HU family DNA-binding protein n=1 Tax=Candidatus Electronema sp. TaxID=2698783 RepID=UPI0040561F49
MTTIQWRPQVNALTKPQSYRPQVVPRGTSGYDKMAADISTANPVYNADLLRSVAPLIMNWIQQELINGWRVTFEDAFTFNPSLTGRMARPDDPLPDDEELLEVNVYASRPFVQAVRQQAKLERLPMNEKLPLITSAEDTKLKLADVLNPAGLLRLTGSNLYFEEDDPDCGCVIAGTQSGEIKQSTFGIISNSEILLVPDIPAQAHPWNNEYTLSLTAQYTEHGTSRTGIYRRRLRSPLTVPGLGAPNPPATGILTDDHATSHVSIDGGSTSANERLRVQVIQDLMEERLIFSLIDMKEDGAKGAEIIVPQNGEYILPGFAGSAVSSIEITVNNYAALWEMIRSNYQGRLVDVLDVMVL